MAGKYWRRWFVEVGVPGKTPPPGKDTSAATAADESIDVVRMRIQKALRDEFGPGYDFDISIEDDEF